MDRSTSWIGKVLAHRYRLIALLGEGSVADVYLARHVLIDRLSAIKLLRSDAAHSPELRSLFLREARAVNRINHPNIVEITDYGETPGTAYLVMDYVAGEPLSRVLGRGPLGWRRAAHAGLQLALALSRAHEMGVVHRDLKPSNVLVAPRRDGYDHVRLTDFGMAKLKHGVTGWSSTGDFARGHLSPGYVAPELFALGTVDSRSDLYSLGVLVYEAATGALPYAPESPISQQRPPPRTSDLESGAPRALDDVLATLLALDPDDRPRDAFEAADMFRAVLEAGADDAPETIRTLPPDFATVPSGPRTLSSSVDRIALVCRQAWAGVRDRALSEVRPGLRDDLRRASELMVLLERLDERVLEDTRQLAATEQRAKRLRSDYGGRLDRLALERSRMLGWAGTLAERSEWARSQRNSGRLSTGRVDAMLWEQAAYDHEEERTRREVTRVESEVESVLRELAEQEEGLDAEREMLEARFEGHVAALRSVAAETWSALESMAVLLGMELSIGSSFG